MIRFVAFNLNDLIDILNGYNEELRVYIPYQDKYIKSIEVKVDDTNKFIILRPSMLEITVGGLLRMLETFEDKLDYMTIMTIDTKIYSSVSVFIDATPKNSLDDEYDYKLCIMGREK